MLFAVTLACSMPGIAQPSTPLPPVTGEIEVNVEEVEILPTILPKPSTTPPPLPPVLVEVDPPPGADLPLQSSFTFYFNQPMDKPSVELALSGQPTLSGRFTWIDDATIVFDSETPLLPESVLNITISTSALAKNGRFLQDPITLRYTAASPLEVTQLIPEPEAEEVNSTSAIVAAFNQPVVSLSTDSSSLPEALTIDPPVPGAGEWVNCSTYIYYPEPALVGGMIYTVRLNPNLTSIYGGPFEGRRDFEVNPFEWTFKTSTPRLVSISPGNGAAAVDLDTTFRVEFNQPMDNTSVEANFTLLDPEQDVVEGDFGWDESFTTLTFTPTSLLARGTYYSLALMGNSRTSGGASLGFDSVARIKTVPMFRIASTQPKNNGIKQVQANVSLNFNGPAMEIEDPFQFITLSPRVNNLSHWWGDFNRALNIQGDFEPRSTYTVTVSEGLPDPWGGNISKPYTFTFKTAALDPAINIAYGSPAMTIRPQDTTITTQVTNIDQIKIRTGSVPFDDLVEIMAPGGYYLYQNYQPKNRLYWTHKVDVPGDKTQIIQLPITKDEQGLKPGIYHLGLSSPALSNQISPILLISSNIQLTFKMSTTSAFVWAVDMRTLEPVAGVPVTVYDSSGVRLISGPTDSQGIFQSPISTQADLHSTYYAMLAEPGEEFFSLSLSIWRLGIGGDDFGFRTDFSASGTTTYLHTDRRGYRPGQKVSFRGVIRYEHNGRYAFPGVETVQVTIFDGADNPLQSIDLDISEFGTIQGEFLLPDDALPGSYRIATVDDSVFFQVHDYWIPEINLSLDAPEALVAGETIEFEVFSRYSSRKYSPDLANLPHACPLQFVWI